MTKEMARSTKPQGVDTQPNPIQARGGENKGRLALSRRRLIFGTGGTAAVAVLAALDLQASNSEEESQWEISDTFWGALDFMRREDVFEYKDPLFGYSYPSTSDVADKIAELISANYTDPSNLDSLFVKEEKDPSRPIRFLKMRLRLKPQTHTSSELFRNSEGPDVLYLPPYFTRLYPQERSQLIFVRGLEYFNPFKEDEYPFEAANYLWLGDLYLSIAYRGKNLPTRIVDNEAFEVVNRALEENDPLIWQEYLKERLQLEPQLEPELAPLELL